MSGVPAQRRGPLASSPVVKLSRRRPGLLRRAVAALRAGAGEWRRSGTA